MIDLSARPILLAALLGAPFLSPPSFADDTATLSEDAATLAGDTATLADEAVPRGEMPLATGVGPTIATIAVRSAANDLENIRREGRPVSLSIPERLIEAAREALDRGLYDDALALATQAREEISRLRGQRIDATEPALPTIAPLFEAEARLNAAIGVGYTGWRIETARDLTEVARAALSTGGITTAEELSRRAISILQGLEPLPSMEMDSRIDINSAPRSVLRSLPGMTYSRIENLIWFREVIGPFGRIEELAFIPGFDIYYVSIISDMIKVETGSLSD